MLQADTAQDHAARRIAVADATTAVVLQAWSGVDPDRIVPSWTEQLPLAAAAVTRGQYAAASLADPYIDAYDLAGAGVEDNLQPAAFAGVASDGRQLVSLLMVPAFQVLQAIGSGLTPDLALAGGAQHLEVITQTQVADAGRTADGVALTTHRRLEGYRRVVAGGACSRCIILAGRWYEWSEGFERHPRCHCTHVPADRGDTAGLATPQQVYDELSPAERARAGWNRADQTAIADGADLSSVTNAHRGVYVAGGKRYTRDAVTRRGLFGGYRIDPETGRLTRRARSDKAGPRRTPEQIYREARGDRDLAVRMLREDGYVRPVPSSAGGPTARAVGDAAGTAAGSGAARSVVEIRAELKAARSAVAVADAFEAEALRITQRPIYAEFEGNVATAREHAEGLLRCLERFPEADLTWVQVGRHMPDASYAEADAQTIRFNKLYTAGAKARQEYLESLTLGVRTNWHPAGMDHPAGIAIHEFGHILDIETLGEVAHDDIEEAVARAGVFSGLGEEALIERDISRYAKTNTHELAAEAFTDVMLNGMAASQLSKDVYAILRREYVAGGRVINRTARVIAGAGPAPEAALMRKLLPELRAMAKERGLVGYSRLTKAKLIERLVAAPAAEPPKPELKPPPGLTVTKVRALLKFSEQGHALADHGPSALYPGVGDLIIRRLAAELKIPDAIRDAVVDSLLAERPALLRSTLKSELAKAGLLDLERVADMVRFDPKQHTLKGARLPAGTEVRVVSPAIGFMRGDDVVRVTKARVEHIDRGRTDDRLTPEQIRILRAVDGTEVSRTTLGGGVTGETSLVDFEDGTTLVRKYLGRRAEGVRKVADQMDAEELSPLVLDAVGVGSATTVRVGDRTLYMDVIVGQLGTDLVPFGHLEPDELLDSPQGRLLGLADHLMENGDRNTGNWFQLAGGDLVGIDHGYSFDGLTSSPFTHRLVVTGQLGAVLSPEQVRAVRERLAALEPDFRRLGRMAWFRRMMKHMKDVG